MAVQICCTCGEENPSEAVMCWACYAPTPGHKGEMEKRPVSPRRGFRSRLSGAWTWIPGLVVLASILRSRGPWRVVFWGLGAILTLENIYRKLCRLTQNRKRAAEDDEMETPVERISNTILLYAVQKGASAIRIQAFSRGLAVHYLIQGEWHEQMKIPKYVSKPLFFHLRLRAGLLDEVSERGAIGVTLNNSAHLMEYSRDSRTETVLLEFVARDG